jgi:hypothetical protein
MWGGWGIYSPNRHKVVVGRLQSHGAPDSRIAERFPEAGEFRVALPWSTGHCPVVHRTVR